DMDGICLAQHAERTRRSNDEEVFGFAALNGFVEPRSQLMQKCALGLIMPVGLFNTAVASADRLVRTAGRCCAEFTRWRIRLIERFNRSQTRKFSTAGISQNQRFAPVADDHPVAVLNFRIRHGSYSDWRDWALRQTTVTQRLSEGVGSL